VITEDAVMTIPEVAAELRCSKAHVYNAINGRVKGVSSLPAIVMGRRKLVRRSTLDRWKCANERDDCGNAILAPSPKVDAVGRA
jgi:excisionase family DNA binding protein